MMPSARPFRWIRRVVLPLAVLVTLADGSWHQPTLVAKADDLDCGNGLLEGSETCEACPADCRVASCPPSRKRRVAIMLDAAPGFENIGTLTVRIGFRSDLLALPGAGTAPAVRSRVHADQSDTTFAVNDLGYAVRVLASRRSGLAPGRIFELEFDTCKGARDTVPGDLNCTVESCAWGGSPLEGCRCTIGGL